MVSLTGGTLLTTVFLALAGWVPFLLDYGCAPMFIGFVVSQLAHLKRTDI